MTSGQFGSPGAAGSTGANGASGQAAAGEEGSPSEDISGNTKPASVPGLYGNQFELQIDASRLPRLDEYSALAGTDGQSMATIPSDVKTVAYYLRSPSSSTSGGSGTSLSSGSQSGLVRRELDRAVSRYATDSGQESHLDSASKVLAPEVTSLEFQYHDGQAWNTSWNSDERGGLPVAIEVRVGMASAKSQQKQRAGGLTPGTPYAASEDDLIYRLVVNLPAAKPLTDTSLDPLSETGEGATGETANSASQPGTGSAGQGGASQPGTRAP